MEKLVNQVNVKFTDEEIDEVKGLAAEQGKNVTEWCHESIMEVVAECGQVEERVRINFSDEDFEQIKFWSEQAGQSPTEWSRAQVLKGLNNSGPSEHEAMMTEFCALANLLGEFMREQLIVNLGGYEAADKRTEELWNKSRKGIGQEAIKLLRGNKHGQLPGEGNKKRNKVEAAEGNTISSTSNAR